MIATQFQSYQNNEKPRKCFHGGKLAASIQQDQSAYKPHHKELAEIYCALSTLPQHQSLALHLSKS